MPSYLSDGTLDSTSVVTRAQQGQAVVCMIVLFMFGLLSCSGARQSAMRASRVDGPEAVRYQ
jgi:hypothetical protein